MAGHEHEAQQIVIDAVTRVDVRDGDLLSDLELATKFFDLPLETCISPQQVDRAMLRRAHQPGARFVRDARLRPLLEGGHQGILRELFCEADVANDPRQTRDEPGRFDPPDRLDRPLDVGPGYCFAAICARWRSSCCLSSGV